MEEHEFEDGSIAKIQIIDESIVVLVDDANMGKIKVSGFASKQDATDFILFGDWQDPNNNSFIKIVRPKYSLTWEFEG
ncbi:MAG: hypothetical protein V2J08_07415 [Desulfotignum sp.]|jgi:hypothetical protein|nr:hypothetical protein [Desulfotignum sp.]